MASSVSHMIDQFSEITNRRQAIQSIIDGFKKNLTEAKANLPSELYQLHLERLKKCQTDLDEVERDIGKEFSDENESDNEAEAENSDTEEDEVEASSKLNMTMFVAKEALRQSHLLVQSILERQQEILKDELKICADRKALCETDIATMKKRQAEARIADDKLESGLAHPAISLGQMQHSAANATEQTLDTARLLLVQAAVGQDNQQGQQACADLLASVCLLSGQAQALQAPSQNLGSVQQVEQAISAVQGLQTALEIRTRLEPK